MARSAEKAMNLMNRWVDQQKLTDSGGIFIGRTSGECTTVKQAESMRAQVIRDLTSLILQVQNPSVGHDRLRQMNDNINKLIKQKFVYELRILQLGGPDHTGIKIEGSINVNGYLYFGAAKFLPEVKDLNLGRKRLQHSDKGIDEHFEDEEFPHRIIQPDYYIDIFEPLEGELQCEAVLKQKALEDWKARRVSKPVEPSLAEKKAALLKAYVH
jgi:pre-mRNA-splicing factor ISY1